MNDNSDEFDELIQNLQNFVDEHVNKPKSKPIRPGLIPHLHYHWCAISTRNDHTKMRLIGDIELEDFPTEQILRTRVIGHACRMAEELGVTWDPFNLSVVAKPFADSENV